MKKIEYTLEDIKRLQPIVDGWRGIKPEPEPPKYVDKDPFEGIPENKLRCKRRKRGRPQIRGRTIKMRKAYKREYMKNKLREMRDPENPKYEEWREREKTKSRERNLKPGVVEKKIGELYLHQARQAVS